MPSGWFGPQMLNSCKFVWLLCLLLLPLPAAAVQQLALSVAELEGEGWRAQGVELGLMPLEGGRLGVRGRVQRLELSAAGETLEALELECPEASVADGTLSCPRGSLLLDHPWVQRKEIAVAFIWRQADGWLRMELKDARIARGLWEIQLEGPLDGRWKLKVAGRGVDLGRMRESARAYLDVLPSKLKGKADLDLDLQTDAGGLREANLQLRLHRTAFSAAADLYQGEGIAAGLQGRIKRDGAGAMSGQVGLRMSDGALLTPFLYLEPGRKPVMLQTGFTLDAAARRLKLQDFSYRHPGVLELEGKVELDLDLEQPQLRSLQLESGQTQAATLYQSCFQPLLSGTLLESVRFDGGFRFKAEQGRGGPLRLDLDLRRLSLEDAPDPDLYPDQQPRFALRGLNGRLQWSDGSTVPSSKLSWHGGQLLGALEFGSATLHGKLSQRDFRLTAPLKLPLLDGALMVDRLDLSLPENEESPRLDFDAILTPISMERLSSAFGWPPLAGSVSGVVPGLSLRRGGVTVAGKLLVRVFDGDILIDRLSLSDLFGFLPVLNADVQLKGLDLETLTKTFSFGKITGRLDGRIDVLRLEDWRPVAFDASFETPKGDDSKRYISQRAVQNISDLGGAGMAGSLSRTFLGLFEEFRYKRLGISCKLRDGICRMGGVEPAEQGYYLVVGSGIPQINIIGFNTRTDWETLVEQLRQATEAGAQDIEIR